MRETPRLIRQGKGAVHQKQVDCDRGASIVNLRLQYPWRHRLARYQTPLRDDAQILRKTQGRRKQERGRDGRSGRVPLLRGASSNCYVGG